MEALTALKRGLILLSACCGSYILFWLNGYQPQKAYRRSQPLSIVLFLLTFVLGVISVWFIVNAMNHFEPEPTPLKGSFIVISAVIVYALSAVVTVHFFNRPVTTELLLITLWTALMVQILNVSCAQNLLSHSSLIISIVLLAAAYLVSMILYVAYYQMEPWPAYWAAAVPLAAIGIDCIVMAVML